MVTGFVKKEIASFKSAGEVLREKRESQGIELSDISRAVKISEENLNFLEEGKYNRLPADVYAKGFLRKYANFLNYSEEKIISIFEKERGVQRKLSEKGRKKTDFKKNSFKASFVTPRLIKIIVVCGIVFAVIIYLWYQFSNFSRNPKLELFEPFNDVTVMEDKITFKGITDIEIFLEINGQEVYVNSDGTFVEEVGLEDGLNTINIVARNKFKNESRLTRSILYEKPKELKEPEVSDTEVQIQIEN